jgi:O-acetyl-ADP-ribose deacetylase (regulator of RNase III)
LKHLTTLTCNSTTVELVQGDITAIECHAVVNPANSLMIMGGGVAGALRRAAGEEVEAEARKHAPVPVGKAISTHAGRLAPRIQYIIHAPTMERPAMRTTTEKVKKAARAALREAARLGVSCVALPAMGAGVGGLTAKESLEAMLEAVDEILSSGEKIPERILIVAYTDTDAKHFLEQAKRIKLRSCKAGEE